MQRSPWGRRLDWSERTNDGLIQTIPRESLNKSLMPWQSGGSPLLNPPPVGEEARTPSFDKLRTGFDRLRTGFDKLSANGWDGTYSDYP